MAAMVHLILSVSMKSMASPEWESYKLMTKYETRLGNINGKIVRSSCLGRSVQKAPLDIVSEYEEPGVPRSGKSMMD